MEMDCAVEWVFYDVSAKVEWMGLETDSMVSGVMKFIL